MKVSSLWRASDNVALERDTELSFHIHTLARGEREEELIAHGQDLIHAPVKFHLDGLAPQPRLVATPLPVWTPPSRRRQCHEDGEAVTGWYFVLASGKAAITSYPMSDVIPLFRPDILLQAKAGGVLTLGRPRWVRKAAER